MSELLINDIRETLASARSQFEYLSDLGIESQTVTLPDASQAQHCPEANNGLAGNLDAIREELGDCQRCGLAASRTKLVYGVGNPNARLVLVGEAPGRHEVQFGVPFKDAMKASKGSIDEYINNKGSKK